MPSNVEYEITCPFPNFIGEWMGNFVPHIKMDAITYPGGFRAGPISSYVMNIRALTEYHKNVCFFCLFVFSVGFYLWQVNIAFNNGLVPNISHHIVSYS